MKILMMTNTYTPMVGGIEESIRSFTAEFERLGHEVIIVAPENDGAPPDETGVIRLRAIRNVNNTNFSIALPMSGLLQELLKTFKADIIHSHHPFWMGDIALRLSSQHHIPLVFTYHTMFEKHMHYLPVQTEGVKRFIVELFTGYANLAGGVIVPSQSVRDILLDRGVTTPIEVIPTGVNLAKFSRGDGNIVRRRLAIPANVKVAGAVCRLALEKNIEFLCECAADYLRKNGTAHFLLIGDGPLKELTGKIFERAGVGKRFHPAGMLAGQDLVDSYHAMDVFAFSSLSETQGIVLTEAMASGVPVVALDAPGIREVVRDGYNGKLVLQQDRETFVEALSWCLDGPVERSRQLKNNARTTARDFDIELCAEKMLESYKEVMAREYVSPDLTKSNWRALIDRLKSEWEIFKNVLQAGGAAIADSTIAQLPLTQSVKGFLRKWYGLLSPAELSARFLRLSRAEGTETKPGLVLIQLDGLSRRRLNKAFYDNKMPFLKGLLRRNYYRLYSHFPGLPSNTPSVQGELFYGVKQIVPSFAFLDSLSGKIFRMHDSEDVIEIESRLAQRGRGLLEGGSSYSNIFRGGARESHFCVSSLGWSHVWKDANPFNSLVLALTHIPSMLRMFVMILWELTLGTAGFFRRVLHAGSFLKEVHYVYARSLICVLLRDMVALGTKIDIARGLPIIHLNLIGYDEVSHDRGPSSRSASRSLKGIDRTIGEIYRNALHSPRRSYDVWIYSDHGQEDTDSYILKYGRSVQVAVEEVLKDFDATAELLPVDKNKRKPKPVLKGGEKRLIVTAFGPTGNIYLPRKMAEEELKLFARQLVDRAKIPVIMAAGEAGTVRVWNAEGDFTLPQDGARVIGADHPLLAQLTEDMIRLCHHQDSGDLTFMGFKPGEKTLTFPVEYGSHTGPGKEETNGFALLPADIIPRQREQSYLAPLDLRYAALRFLKGPVSKGPKQFKDMGAPGKPSIVRKIRVMTYNVHSCVGMDGKVSPERIARVISRHEPDIVALQELDRGRKRTGEADQPHIIARELEMNYHFQPFVISDTEGYGIAVLSRYPMELIRAGRLPALMKKRMEPRGVIWVVININGTKINFLNTHLGFFPSEGYSQTQALLGPEWLSHPACGHRPVILCGDFNASPNSRIYRAIRRSLNDSRGKLDFRRSKKTWPSRYPVARLDHVFASADFEAARVIVSRTDLDKISSDHLPLIVDLKLVKDPLCEGPQEVSSKKRVLQPSIF